MLRIVFLFYAISAFLLSGCYSFKGISIPPNVNTFFVQNFETVALNAPPTLAVNFTEQLKDKVRNETRLVLRNNNPDVEFSGKMTNFYVKPIAPQPGNDRAVARNQLIIEISVMYTDHKNENKTWKSEWKKEFFAEFGTDEDLLSIQNRLIDQIFDQLLEDLFNQAFNDW